MSIQQQQFELKRRRSSIMSITPQKSPKKKKKHNKHTFWFQQQQDDYSIQLEQQDRIPAKKVSYMSIHRDSSLSTIVDIQEQQQVIRSTYIFENGLFKARPNSTLHDPTFSFKQYLRKDTDHNDLNYGLKPKYKRIYSSKIEKHRQMLVKDRQKQMTKIDDESQRMHFQKFFNEFFNKQENQEIYDEETKNCLLNKQITQFDLIKKKASQTVPHSPRSQSQQNSTILEAYEFDKESKM
eukprot:403351548